MYFPIDNMHFTIFEDFIKDTEFEINKIFQFLEIDRQHDINYEVWENKPRGVKHPKILRTYNSLKTKRINKVLEKVPDKLSVKIKENFIRKFIYIRNDKVFSYEKNWETCRELMKLYEEDISELEAIISKDLSIWTNKYKGVK